MMRWNLCLSCFGVALSVAACAADEPLGQAGDGQPLPQGVTLFTQNAFDGLTGMYAEGRRAVFFETVRQNLDVEPYEDHPYFDEVGQPIGVSVRFVDAEGRNLATSVFDQMPPQWDSEAPPEYRPGDMEEQAILFGLVVTAGRLIADHPVDESMAPEVAAMVEVSRMELQAPAHDKPEAYDGGDGLYTAAGCDCGPGNIYRVMEIWRKYIAGNNGEHSAVKHWNCESWVGCGGVYSYANHGSWDGMSRKCSNVSPWYYGVGAHISNAGNCEPWGGYGWCTTPWGGSHNCHDDTKFQRERLLCDRHWTWCTATGCDIWAPVCHRCGEH